MSEFCYEIVDSPDEIIEICKEKSEEGWDFVSFTFRDKYSNCLIEALKAARKEGECSLLLHFLIISLAFYILGFITTLIIM